MKMLVQLSIQTPEDLRYATQMYAMHIRNDIERTSRQIGYVVGVDFKTMKPIYWEPTAAETVKDPALKKAINDDKGFLYTNIGEMSEVIVPQVDL